MASTNDSADETSKLSPGDRNTYGTAETSFSSAASINDGEIDHASINDGEIDQQKEEVRRVWPLYFLRLFLFSPLKWKKDAFWISVPHSIWFFIHLAKIILLTMVTVKIAWCRSGVSTIEDNRYVALEHILLKNWESSYETVPYPPSQGKFAVYSVEDFQSGINYAVEQYYNAEIEATGHFSRTKEDNITVNIRYYDLNLTQTGRIKIVKSNIHFPPDKGLSYNTNKEGKTVYRYNITKDLIDKNLQGVLKRVFELYLEFFLHAVRIDEDRNDAVCHQIHGNVTFLDKDRDGQMVVTLNTQDIPANCCRLGYDVEEYNQCVQDHSLQNSVEGMALLTVLLDGLGFFTGLCLLLWTWRYLEGKNYQDIYKPLENSETNLPWQEYFWSVQWWLVFSCAADAFTLKGLCGIGRDVEKRGGDEYDAHLEKLDKYTLYLGSGCLLTWFSLLRFVRISPKFSVLFKTVRKSALDVLFFLICATILYIGFVFSAFIVLGPYHVKFMTFSSTSETLFAIINGDEIYATFAILQEKYSGDKEEIKKYLKVIVYIYVSLFTVLMFNLLIALFNSAYETVKESYSSEKETKPLVTALCNYLSHTDDDLSRNLQTFINSNDAHTEDNEDEAELKRILRKYVLVRVSTDGTAYAERRERSMFYLMNSGLQAEMNNVTEQNYPSLCLCKVFWLFGDCWCKCPGKVKWKCFCKYDAHQLCP